MLSMPGLGCKEYEEKAGRGCPVPKVPCPGAGCGGRVQQGHGFYYRFVGGFLFLVRRLICVVCGVTNALLPEDICAYQDVTLAAVEAAVDAKAGPSAGAKAAGVTGPEGKRQARRWRIKSRQWVDQILTLLALLPSDAEPQSWLALVRAVVGDGPGALLRLRWWLWTGKAVYLGGPCGLFLRGRPLGRLGATPT